MSVIVKNMEMPDNCFECPCCRHDSVDGIKMEQCNLTLDAFDANYFERWNGRAQNCPLVEIPTPYGRLIDADELAKHKYENIWTNRLIIDADDLDDAPTVIEGSET